MKQLFVIKFFPFASESHQEEVSQQRWPVCGISAHQEGWKAFQETPLISCIFAQLCSLCQ
jgi:hypothetical protein